MKRLAFAFGILTLSLCVAPPAFADFAVTTLTAAHSARRTGSLWCSDSITISSTASIPGSRRREPCIGLSRGMSAEWPNSH